MYFNIIVNYFLLGRKTSFENLLNDKLNIQYQILNIFIRYIFSSSFLHLDYKYFYNEDK